jgi:hypothetical protein
MTMEKIHQIYIIEQKLKNLQGRKNLILSGESETNDILEDIDSKIKVLNDILDSLKQSNGQ